MAEEAVKNGDATNGSTKAVTFSAMKMQLFVEAPKANDAVLFYKAAFGAEEVNRVSQPKRKADQELPLVISAEIKLGGTTIIVSDISDDSPAPIKSGTGSVFCLETEDIDGAVEKAVEAGAVKEGEVAEADGACCGGRVEKVKDPYGNFWMICSPPAAKKDGPAADADAEVEA
ncbi:Early tobacco anther 1 [Heracleum sosnowskyi]|uniref:Early tobacco anther 1 n=1 Tax=Heracleum sosnowskyi TaxID=360622 RepID=A0AAD8J6D2_9APIA|nr:Early tobacco anther 1 [Heracleum sosnowskyi]